METDQGPARRKLLLILSWLTVVIVCQSHAAEWPSPAAQRQPFRNHDVRRPAAPPPARAMPSLSPLHLPMRREAEAGVRIDRDPVLGTARYVRDLSGLLRSADDDADQQEETPGAGESRVVIERYLKENAAELGHGPEVLRGARLIRDHSSPASGLRIMTWQQYLVGIPVFEALLTASLTDAAGLVALSTQFVPDPARAAATGPERRRSIDAQPRIKVREAARTAYEAIGEPAPLDAFAVRRTSQDGWSESQELSRAGSRAPVIASLVWLPLSATKLTLCWRVIVENASGHRFQVLVDARTGQTQLRHSWSQGIAPSVFRVFSSDSPSPFSPGHPQGSATNQPLDISTFNPEFTNQVTLSVPANSASPMGWVNDSAAFNFPNTTVGNNVDAHLDLFNADPNYDQAIASPPEPRPVGTMAGGELRFDFTADLAQPPLGSTNLPATSNQKAAVVNAFYWCNWIHDRLWQLGFNEGAGNFQRDNFGRGGLGGDPVLVDVQNGAVLGQRNSGFFSASPIDGTPARISLSIWNGPAPERDGAFDVEVLLHEYMHLVSMRRVGHGTGLSSDEALGLAEGWSDFISLCLLGNSGDDFGGAYAYGAFSTYRWSPFGAPPLLGNYHYGMRRYPYSTNMLRNPLTFNDLDALDANGHLAVPVSPVYQPYDPFSFAYEVHCIGEVWAVTLWDCFAFLVQKHGFVAARELMLKTVLDGMSLCPPNPTMLQARDALILADRVLTGGANWNELWRAFARRGMGWSAPEPVVVGVPRITPAFDLPPSGQTMPGWPFAAKSGVRSSPALGTNAIYVGSGDGRLYSLSPAGVTNWVFFPPGLAPFVSTPAVHSDGTIYAKRKNGWLYALKPDGSVKWSNRIDAISITSPAIASDGTVYIAGNRDLNAFQPDGTFKWKYVAGKTILSSPSIASDGTIYFGSADGRLHAVDPVSGAGRAGWPFQTGKPIASSAALSASGTVFFGCQNKRVYAVNGTTAAKLWEFATGGSVESSPALGTNNTLYVGSDDRRLYALRASSGQLRWSYQTGGAIRSSPAVSADGIVYVGSNDGYLYALQAESGQLIYRFRLGGTLPSSPLIASDGVIYAASSNGKVIALRGATGPAASDWPMFRRSPYRHANLAIP